MQRSMMLRRSAAVLAISLFAAACGGGSEPADTETTPSDTETTATETEPDDEETTAAAGASIDGTLKIGTILPQTGDLAVLGPAMTEAVQLAVEQINEAGGVLGGDVQLAIGDSGTNEDVANDTADRMIQSERVDAIIGAASSRISLSIIDKITGAGVVQCSPSNTGSSLTTYEDDVPGFYFRTAPPDNLQGPALADVIVGDGNGTVAVIALNDEYGQGFADFLKQGLEEAGAEVVADVAYDPAGQDFSADVQEVIDSGAEAVAVISFPDTGVKILTGLLEGGYDPSQLYTADGMQGDAVITDVDPQDNTVLNGMKGTAPSSQGSEAFTAAFDEFKSPDTPQIFSAHAYDCVIVIALAAAIAGTDDPAAIAAEMVGVTRDGEKCSDFASCIELVNAGTDIDYDGASGPGEWAPEGEPAAGTYEVWEFRDGAVNTLSTVDVG
jgi:ABC-type branched-subunit amino acid transport system substrate-binding protein